MPKTYTLRTAHVFYGKSVCTINGIEEAGFGTLTEGTPISRRALCEALAHCVGGLSSAQFAERLKVARKPAEPEFSIREHVTAYGNGFCLVWTLDA